MSTEKREMCSHDSPELVYPGWSRYGDQEGRSWQRARYRCPWCGTEWTEDRQIVLEARDEVLTDEEWRAALDAFKTGAPAVAVPWLELLERDRAALMTKEDDVGAKRNDGTTSWAEGARALYGAVQGSGAYTEQIRSTATVRGTMLHFEVRGTPFIASVEFDDGEMAYREGFAP